MSKFPFSFAIDSLPVRAKARGRPPRAAGPDAIFVRIARAIAEEVRRGRLRPGDRLPGTRELASALGFNRNTIVAAYAELASQGWIDARGASGTFVSNDLPERTPVRAKGVRPPGHPARPPSEGASAAPGFELRAPAVAMRAALPPMHAKGSYFLAAGVPDTRLLPGALLARAYRRALRDSSRGGALDYGDARGSPRLRAAIAEMLRATRAVAASPERILITRGSQMAIDLVARLLVRPGDAAAVESPGYRAAWDSLRAAGARLEPIEVDAAGLLVEELAKRMAPRAHARNASGGQMRIRCLHTTPHHQYPTTVLASPARRMALLELAAREKLAIIEDDYDHEFHYEGRPVAPLASEDRAGVVIYVGTFSKVLAPGLRLGFLVAPEPVVRALASLRFVTDRQGDHLLENTVAELIEDGDLQRHVRKMRRVYQARRDALVELLDRELGGVLSFRVPAGGMTLWARVDDRVSLERWRARAQENGVDFGLGRNFDIEGRPRPFIRLGFAAYAEAELRDAVRRMRAALASAG